MKFLAFLLLSVFCSVQIVQADPRNNEILDRLVEKLKHDCAADVRSGTVLGEPIVSGVSVEKDNYFSLTPEAIAYFENSETGAEIIVFRPGEAICAESNMQSLWCGSAGCNCTEITEGKTNHYLGHDICHHEGHLQLLPAERRRLERQKAEDKNN